MKCNKCGFQYEGNFCSHCGEPAPAGPDLDGEEKFDPKMKRCKVCGKQIVKQAKLCPHCGARVKKTPVLLIVLLAIIFIGVIGSMGNEKEDTPARVGSNNNVQTPPTKNAKPQNNSTVSQNSQDVQKDIPIPEPTPEVEPEPEQTTYGIGDTAEDDGVSVTLVNVWENSGQEFFKPSQGNIFVLCEFEIENSSKKELHISSIADFDIYVDDYSADLSFTAETSVDKPSLDGTIAAGKKMNGVIGLETASDWSNIEIHFTPSLFGDEMVFTYSKWAGG